jgi:hypothetical protein
MNSSAMPSSSVAPSASSDAEHETAGPGHEGRGEIGAHHVERAVRQIDEIHDAEHQRQPGRQQEQQQAELQPFSDCSTRSSMNLLYVEGA